MSSSPAPSSEPSEGVRGDAGSGGDRGDKTISVTRDGSAASVHISGGGKKKKKKREGAVRGLEAWPQDGQKGQQLLGAPQPSRRKLSSLICVCLPAAKTHPRLRLQRLPHRPRRFTDTFYSLTRDPRVNSERALRAAALSPPLPLPHPLHNLLPES